MNLDPMHVETDVLVIGAGGAGMYAAIEAARAGCRVLLADRSLIGRGGATVMAQMTVAAALGSEVPDHWSHHYDDTLESGRGLCDERLARLLCEHGPECIRELDEWGIGWARKDGHITQVLAPGHDRPRCVYVDFLNTGPAVSKTLRGVVTRAKAIHKAGDLLIVDLILVDGAVAGGVALHLPTGAPVTIAAKATIIASGGLTRLYRRNSASANMGGDGYALALRAGAPLVDMEFVQFFPIGHLAPRLIGMDPIMWDPFRYKLGGRLLNSEGEEFTARYGVSEDGQYLITRDLATYAIVKEAEAGRGSPHGGAYLSFEHCSESELRAAFGPVIDRLARNKIDLTRMPVEVAPIAHYHMGGVVADERMETEVPALLVAGEAVGGANGANRLSGNAITEALVFGRRAGRSAAERVRQAGAHAFHPAAARDALDLFAAGDRSQRHQYRRHDPETAGHHGGRRRSVPHQAQARARARDHRRDGRRAGRAPGRRRQGLRPAPARMVRLAQHAPGGADGCGRRARARREPRRPPTRGFSRHAAGVASQPGRAARFRRHRADPGARDRAGGRAMSSIAKLKVWRGDSPDTGRWESYDVPFEPGQSVLDGLRWIRVSKDPSLAIRFSCINANACKECMIELDGKTVYACTARLEPREMMLAPLSNKPLVRDLVTEIAPPAERFSAQGRPGWYRRV